MEYGQPIVFGKTFSLQFSFCKYLILNSLIDGSRYAIFSILIALFYLVLGRLYHRYVVKLLLGKANA